MPFFNAKKKKYKNFELFGYIPNKLSYKAVKMKSGNDKLCSLYSNNKTNFLFDKFFFILFRKPFKMLFWLLLAKQREKTYGMGRTTEFC